MRINIKSIKLYKQKKYFVGVAGPFVAIAPLRHFPLAVVVDQWHQQLENGGSDDESHRRHAGNRSQTGRHHRACRPFLHKNVK